MPVLHIHFLTLAISLPGWNSMRQSNPSFQKSFLMKYLAVTSVCLNLKKKSMTQIAHSVEIYFLLMLQDKTAKVWKQKANEAGKQGNPDDDRTGSLINEAQLHRINTLLILV